MIELNDARPSRVTTHARFPRTSAIALAATLLVAACGGEKTQQDDEPESLGAEVTGAETGESSDDEAAGAGSAAGEADDGHESGPIVSEGPVTISFPAGFPPPERRVEDQVLFGVGPVELTSFMSSAAEQRRMAGVSYHELPDGAATGRSPEQVISDARDGAVSRMEGTILTQETFERDGHPVVETLLTRKIQGRDGFFRLQVHVVDSYLVQAMFIGTERERVLDEVADAYFESLKIEPPARSP
jgi:hypothetical protein